MGIWADDESKELKERISQMRDEELLRMVNRDFADYRDEALGLAKLELEKRGIPASQSSDYESKTTRADGQEARLNSPANTNLSCDACGGRMRDGVLFADQEMTIVFSDNNEERFVQVLACGRCGQVRLVVDFETDVQEG